MDLLDAVYSGVRDFPKSEVFGLAQQLKRAATSIPCNIAEGRGRYTIPDQQHFLRQARGSVQELKTEIEIAVRQQFMSKEVGRDLMKRAIEVSRLISGLLRSLRPEA